MSEVRGHGREVRGHGPPGRERGVDVAAAEGWAGRRQEAGHTGQSQIVRGRVWHLFCPVGEGTAL